MKKIEFLLAMRRFFLLSLTSARWLPASETHYPLTGGVSAVSLTHNQLIFVLPPCPPNHGLQTPSKVFFSNISDTEIGPCFGFPIQNPGFGCTLLTSAGFFLKINDFFLLTHYV